jgi:hypothetical protein
MSVYCCKRIYIYISSTESGNFWIHLRIVLSCNESQKCKQTFYPSKTLVLSRVHVTFDWIRAQDKNGVQVKLNACSIRMLAGLIDSSVLCSVDTTLPPGVTEPPS